MMACIKVQCILDCIPFSVSAEPGYSDDQFANSYSNPYKLYINAHHFPVAYLTDHPNYKFFEFFHVFHKNSQDDSDEEGLTRKYGNFCTQYGLLPL